MAAPAKKAKTAETQYDALSRVTTIVADTGVIDQSALPRRDHQPVTDLQGGAHAQYSSLVYEAVAYGRQHGGSFESEVLACAIDRSWPSALRFCCGRGT